MLETHFSRISFPNFQAVRLLLAISADKPKVINATAVLVSSPFETDFGQFSFTNLSYSLDAGRCAAWAVRLLLAASADKPKVTKATAVLVSSPV